MSGSSLTLEGIVKRYPGVVANDGVDLAAVAGEVHAIVGENGAGKTTLMRVVAGLTRPDAGTVRIGGTEVSFRSAAEAARAGVGMVHQHFTLVRRFTVIENIVLGRAPALLHDLGESRRELVALADRLGFAVDPDARVEALSVGEQQRVEILRTLLSGARILALDEPTAVLAPGEALELYRLLRSLADEGRTVLFISHRLREVLASSDRITVMRAGRAVATVRTEETDERELARLMVGRDVVLSGREEDRGPVTGPVVLSFAGLSAESDRGVDALRGVDLTVRAGEIVGVAGIQGNGQTELVEVALGTRPATAGTVTVAGEDVTDCSVAERLKRGIGVVPEDRHATGLVPGMSAEENLALGLLARGAVPGRCLIPRDRLREAAASALAELEVRPPTPAAAADTFSGGNQQKILIARALAASPGVLLLAEPARGLDVGATERVHAAIRAARDAGAGVLLVSTDLDELLALSDRILVLRRGAISGEVSPGETTEEELGLLMAGGAG